MDFLDSRAMREKDVKAANSRYAVTRIQQPLKNCGIPMWCSHVLKDSR